MGFSTIGSYRVQLLLVKSVEAYNFPGFRV